MVGVADATATYVVGQVVQRQTMKTPEDEDGEFEVDALSGKSGSSTRTGEWCSSVLFDDCSANKQWIVLCVTQHWRMFQTP